MKKRFLTISAVIALCLPTFAATNMCVKQQNGEIVKFNVDKVVEVYYEAFDPNQVVDESETPLKFRVLSDNTVEVKSGSYDDLTEIVVPAKVMIQGKEYTVTGIGEDAFYWCSDLKSVSLPSTITTIGAYAFYDCTGITYFDIPESVTTIGTKAFMACYGLKNITIPASVKTIGTNAFADCKNLSAINASSDNSNFSSKDGVLYNKDLTKIICVPEAISGKFAIPTTVTSIENYAFYGCKSLTSIDIPEGLTTIKESAFENCNGLTSVKLPSSITEIQESAFYSCENLESINIPDGLTEIADYAFDDCSSLKNIEIPSTVTRIGEYAFAHCYEFTDITLPESITSIGESAFYDCKNLESINIPSGITSISEDLFYDCSSLNNIKLHDKITAINDYAFYGCSSLTSIEIPSSVKTIGYKAFKDCVELKSIEIPASVSELREQAFYGCSYDLDIKISSENPYISYENSILFNKNMTELKYAIKDIIGSYDVPETVTSIGRNAFYGTKVTSVSIPAATKSIEYSAFYACEKLTSINVDSDNTQYSSEDGVLYNKSKTKIIRVPSAVTDPFTILPTVTSIGEYAFYGCLSLTSLEIPSSVTTFGDYAFSGCYYLNVTVNNSQSNLNLGWGVFSSCKSVKYAE